MMTQLDRATVYSPERDDSMLGDGWTWSERHLGKVEHRENDVTMTVKRGSLWFKLQKTNNSKVKLEGSEEWPYTKMVMLTYFPEAIQTLATEFMR